VRRWANAVPSPSGLGGTIPSRVCGASVVPTLATKLAISRACGVKRGGHVSRAKCGTQRVTQGGSWRSSRLSPAHSEYEAPLNMVLRTAKRRQRRCFTPLVRLDSRLSMRVTAGRHTGGRGRLPPNTAYLLAVPRRSARRQRRASCASTCRSSISTARSSVEQPIERRHALSRRDSVLTE